MIKTINNAQFGDYVKDKLTGIEGYLTTIYRFIAGCEYVTIQYKCSLKNTNEEHFVSSHMVDIIHSEKREKYCEIYKLAIQKNINLEIIPGHKVRNRDGNLGVVSMISFDSNGYISCGLIHPFDKANHIESQKNTISSLAELQFISHEYLTEINKNLDKRKVNALEWPEVGDYACCFIDGLAGYVTHVEDLYSGTAHVTIQPKSVNNTLTPSQIYDVELIRILKSNNIAA